MPDLEWPYLSTIIRLALALALGLFIGLERERRDKEAGLRTFGLAALMGAVGGLLGTPFAVAAIALLGILIVVLNVQSFLKVRKTELTTSVAFLLTGLTGVLCGLGHTLAPTAIAIITAALLAWKRPLSHFTLGLTEQELRSAIFLAILAFVVYPALPEGTIDKWHLIEPRTAWITVIVIAGLGFINYILWKLYGKRGVKLAGFLAGLVNSTIAIHNLVHQTEAKNEKLDTGTFQSIILASIAMIIRNAVLLLILAPWLLLASLLPFGLMIAGGCAFIFFHSRRQNSDNETEAPNLKLKSPFSLISALQIGFFFLILQVGTILAQNAVGQPGVMAISFLGGLFSSAAEVAAISVVANKETISGNVGAIAAVITTLASLLISWSIVFRTRQWRLLKKVGLILGIIAILGLIGVFIQITLF